MSQLPAGEDWRPEKSSGEVVILHIPCQRRPLSKILSPAFTVQADETFKPRVEWSEMFQRYIERNQGGLLLPRSVGQPNYYDCMGQFWTKSLSQLMSKGKYWHCSNWLIPPPSPSICGSLGALLRINCDILQQQKTIYPPLVKRKFERNKPYQPNMFWTALKKGFSFGISASLKIGQGSHFNLYVGYFYRTFRNRIWR